MLEQLLAAIERAEKEGSGGPVEGFLEQLDDGMLKALRGAIGKAPRAKREEIERVLVGLDGHAEAQRLFATIRQDLDNWVDELPEGPLELAEQALLKEVTGRSRDDLMLEFWTKNGFSPEDAQRSIESDRRNSKWVNTRNAMLPMQLQGQSRVREDGIRRACPAISRTARKLATVLPSLSIDRQRAVDTRDGLVCELLDAISEALRVGRPDAPSVGTSDGGRMTVLVRRPEDAFLWNGYDVGMEAGELADGVSTGGAIDANELVSCALKLQQVADQAEAELERLERERGRPSKAALDAAEALKRRGLTWAQIAGVLDAHGLHLDPHTANNIRKSVQARRRVKTKTPAKK